MKKRSWKQIPRKKDTISGRERERERIKNVGSKRGRRLYVWNDGHLLMF